ncbi:hypothetical protein [Clostridium sp.]|uniref:hypothetical protein n=1 Tax=Clostridium sp. TaxID=1506 RepID=UPI003217A748
MLTTIEQIKGGTCQFNATTAKKFRTSLAKWHNANFDIANEVLKKTDRVKALETLVNSNLEVIEGINEGKKPLTKKTVAELQSEVDTWNNTIQSENDAMAEYRKAQADRLEKGESLISKDLYKEYVNFIENNVVDNYTLAIANFLEDNGVTPCNDTITSLIAAIGKRVNSARSMCKSGRHNGVVSFQSWRKLFLGELCDLMGDALPLYKFTYVLKDKRDSNKKTA